MLQKLSFPHPQLTSVLTNAYKHHYLTLLRLLQSQHSSKFIDMFLVSVKTLSQAVTRNPSSQFSSPCLSPFRQAKILSRSLTGLTGLTKPVHPRILYTYHPQNFTMSSKGFSNTSTGDAPADPYKAKNKDDPSLEEKIETLNSFVSSCKFGMMTTHNASSNLLVSRCMAVAAKVCLGRLRLPISALPG